jgi:hypothetical protein
MRVVLCAEREDGRSYFKYDGVPENLTLNPGGIRLESLPPVLRDGESARAVLIDPPGLQPADIHFPFDAERIASLDLRLGAIRWTIATIGPNVAHDLHRTATLDLDVVIAGRIVIGCDEGETELQPGDAVIIPGTRHAWRTAAAGATLSFAMAGLMPPPGS